MLLVLKFLIFQWFTIKKSYSLNPEMVKNIAYLSIFYSNSYCDSQNMERTNLD